MIKGSVGTVILIAVIILTAVFVTQKIERFLMKFHYKMRKRAPKHRKKMSNDGMIHIAAPTLACLSLCVTCFCGTSWAWFNAAHINNVTSIQAAVYDVDVAVSAIDGESVDAVKNNTVYEFSLEEGQKYSVVLRKSGSAKNGYCKISLDDVDYYTLQINDDNQFVFNIEANQAVLVKLIPQWGTCSVTENRLAKDDSITYGVGSDSSNQPQDNPQVTMLPSENSAQPVDVTVDSDAEDINDDGNDKNTEVITDSADDANTADDEIDENYTDMSDDSEMMPPLDNEEIESVEE